MYTSEIGWWKMASKHNMQGLDRIVATKKCAEGTGVGYTDSGIAQLRQITSIEDGGGMAFKEDKLKNGRSSHAFESIIDEAKECAKKRFDSSALCFPPVP
jgi:hypothetical protein